MAQTTTRRGVLSAAAAGTAVLVGIGFDRRAGADDHESITQLAKFKINPDKRDDALAALEELASAVEKLEPGVLAYIPHTQGNDENQVVFFEVYENQAALDAHGQQPHLAKLREHFAGGLFQPPVEIIPLEPVGGFMR